jgi:Uma2 family endonuclease
VNFFDSIDIFVLHKKRFTQVTLVNPKITDWIHDSLSQEESGRILSNKMKENKIEGAPDLVVEVLSPSTAYYDLKHKKSIYEKNGVKEYWIVFPEQKVIEVFVLKDGKYSLLCSTENSEGIVTSIVLQNLKFNVADVFEG